MASVIHAASRVAPAPPRARARFARASSSSSVARGSAVARRTMLNRRRSAGRSAIAPILRAVASSDADEAMKSEESAYDKRKEESEAAGVKENEIRPPRGGDPPPTGGRWEWTLNWDPVVFDASASPPAAIESPTDAQLASSKLVIGSCPRSPADVDRLIDEGGVEAIICLQCTLCHGALEIDWEPIRRRALDRDVPIVRVAVRDFDRLDQAKMLPEMVRKLALFQAMGKRTYVHCTAGINRASLTVLGYLTFCKARPLASMTPFPYDRVGVVNADP
ncbi:uncharacterized protein MICPUCDRAFT_58020 [Micromonas pusilla CCMP1545]|uniref:Predicted protein n=1 Tax=Micromonas pusilla (strain CCMP1545) TaxID=564608 RepID=C1MTC5_MICPC|nr:uncharacterized protein MICPUCDRAFT_58020 [Micromonas pusilla CCMP1545]EEH57296.1 predicted protein [Micromonas pusilla CCMP1545]|eukprot:XP_003058841.1 predicted protein [Micromonas pusilla CCMP1545]